MASLKLVIKKLMALGVILGVFAGAGIFAYLILSNLRFVGSIAFFLAPFIITIIVLHNYTSLRQPIRDIGRRIFLTTFNTSVYRRRFMWEQLYDILCWLIPSTEWKHMNWGYAALNHNGAFIKNLDPEDERERFSIQLYHYMATAMGLWNDLQGKTLVEVSSGRGGGLDYISRYLNPKKCIGVDLSNVQIDYCKKIYGHNSKLQFLNGESEKLSKIEELADENVDIIINVESGHCYSNFKKFVEEVDRVLKPGGLFAYSDFRPTHEWEQTEKELESFSLKIVKKENISENVMKSLKLDEERKVDLIKSRLGPVLRFFFRQIGGVKGSHIVEGLRKGRMRSVAYVLKKC
jgi:SAM-dependent methyltransferase